MSDPTTPDPNVRRDIGGWISGPCMPVSDEDRHSTYYAAVGRAGDELEEALSHVRAEQDAGRLTTRQAAGERVRLLEAHLEQVQNLRRKHLGGT